LVPIHRLTWKNMSIFCVMKRKRSKVALVMDLTLSRSISIRPSQSLQQDLIYILVVILFQLLLSLLAVTFLKQFVRGTGAPQWQQWWPSCRAHQKWSFFFLISLLFLVHSSSHLPGSACITKFCLFCLALWLSLPM
jgi:hypothetical protein